MSNQESQPSSQRSWCWWSTHETIQNEVPSVTAILETIIAVALYWWIALHTGWVLPLLISVAVAPFALLRSEQSVALGVTWLLSWENASNVKTYSDLEVGQKRVVWTIVWLLAVMSFSVAYFYAYASKSIFVGLLIWPMTFFFLSGLLRQFSPPLHYPKYLEDLV